MAHRLVLLLSIWCALQAAAHGQLRFDKQGKLGLPKQGPALGAIFGPASRMRMAADDSARQQATNDMSSLLLSMMNQGGPAAGAPAATQPAELSSMDGSDGGYPMQMQQQCLTTAATAFSREMGRRAGMLRL
ncbi:hypothetical protein OEZ86_005542 [Tetradesmus obliquus]|nr:hypothetical protein OEZ86_005542 [Tetradesmus obliquus]